GYQDRTAFSKEMVQYAMWICECNGIQFQFSLNGGEVSCGPYHIDLVQLDQNGGLPKNAVEYAGCVLHGCPKCYADRDLDFHGFTMDDRHRDFLSKICFLREQGYK
ncbi:unnamed protein product, partial [Owenia fusiformis]